jgi:hypothetical protein
MKKQIINFARGLVLIPFLSFSSSLSMIHSNLALLGNGGQGGSAISITKEEQAADEAAKAAEAVDLEHAQKIDSYFADRDMPLEGYGAKLVDAADKYDLDWRLLPAIAIKESTGGRFACGNNPFGWGSCKIKFKTVDAAIDTVARNLGGGNPATERYYKDTTTKQKLHQYNGTVVPTYTAGVLKFMDLIEQVDLGSA